MYEDAVKENSGLDSLCYGQRMCQHKSTLTTKPQPVAATLTSTPPHLTTRKVAEGANKGVEAAAEAAKKATEAASMAAKNQAATIAGIASQKAEEANKPTLPVAPAPSLGSLGNLVAAGSAVHREPDGENMQVCEHNEGGAGGEAMEAFPDTIDQEHEPYAKQLRAAPSGPQEGEDIEVSNPGVMPTLDASTWLKKANRMLKSFKEDARGGKYALDTHVEGQPRVHTNFDLFVEFMHKQEQKDQMLGRNMAKKKSLGKKWQHCATRLMDAINDDSDAMKQWDHVAIPLEKIKAWSHGRVKDISISHVWVYF